MKICYMPSDFDAPGFYRCLSPGKQLHEQAGVEVIMPPYDVQDMPDGRKRINFQFNVQLPRSADLYVLQQRKERFWATEGVMKLRALGMAITADVDDNYVNVPEYNPAFYGTHPYRRDDGVILNYAARRKLKKANKGWTIPPNKNNLLHLHDQFRQVDLLTVSTPHLANAYEPYNKNIKIIRNYLDWDVWDSITPQYEVERERIRIGYLAVFRYRRNDLVVLQRVLPRFLRDHPNVDFVTNSEETHEFLNVPEKQRITIGEYDFQPLDDVLPVGAMTAVCDIGLVPMAMNDLNQSKSHLKGMEYNAAGIPFIASPTESYKDYWCDEGQNGLLANSEDDWYYHMEYLVELSHARKNMGKYGREKAQRNTIQRHWRHWYNAYYDLAGGSYKKLARQSISMGAVQKASELAPFLKLVGEMKPRIVVEIGTASGGTFWGIAKVASQDATMISIDIPAGSPLDQRDGKDVYVGRNRDQIKTYLNGNQKLRLIDMNSQTHEAYVALLAALDGNKIDLLFIDGDHRYEGVKHDWETYSPLVRNGGIIAFHDIVIHKDKRVGVHKLWDEIQQEKKELLGPETWGYNPWGGIGVVYA